MTQSPALPNCGAKRRFVEARDQGVRRPRRTRAPRREPACAVEHAGGSAPRAPQFGKAGSVEA